MTKKPQQLFKTIDIMYIFFALIFTFLICIKFGWSFFTPEYSKVAKKEAIINAYQLLELEFRYFEKINFFGSKKIKEKRELASFDGFEKVSVIGNDPWENHYFYAVQRLNDTKIQITVWSSGPDGKNNSVNTIPNFSGDDIGESLVVNF